MERFFIFLFSCLIISGCQSQAVPSKEVNQIETERIDGLTEREEIVKEPDELAEPAEVDQPNEQYVINKSNWLVEPINDSNDRVVLLTIDDAPERYSVDMAATLKDLKAGAIFFVNGHFLQTDEGKDKLKQIYEMGFEIGNHTMSHPNMNQLSTEDQRKQIIELNDLIEEIIGERPRFYRAPFGLNTEVSDKVVIEEEMTSMNWTYGYDWEKEYQESDSLADIMINTSLLTKGANLLIHDRQWTSLALEEIVIGLREKGFEIVNPNSIITENLETTN
jgi:peptidoglycan/xylan/chitin deacetylase (PgdA/CDA1 family)